jgi:hypothetical protein
MTWLERIPLLEDEELTNLWTNARRLSETGNDVQRETAVDLLPAIESEIAGRRARRKEEIARRAAERRARTARLAPARSLEAPLAQI